MEDFRHTGALLNIASRAFGQALDTRAQEIGLTSVQMHILHYICLNKTQSLNQRDLEQHFELSHATVSGICSRLESKGFIISATNNNDRRCRYILPTDKALECNDEMHVFIRNCENRLLGGFSEKEASELTDYFMRMLHNLDVELPEKYGCVEEQK